MTRAVQAVIAKRQQSLPFLPILLFGFPLLCSLALKHFYGLLYAECGLLGIEARDVHS